MIIKNLVAILTFSILFSILVFMWVSTYFLFTLKTVDHLQVLDHTMLQTFIVIFGMLIAIGGYWGYTGIKDKAVEKAREEAITTINNIIPDLVKQNVKEFMNKNNDILVNTEEGMKDVR